MQSSKLLLCCLYTFTDAARICHLEALLYNMDKVSCWQQLKHKTKLVVAVNMELGCIPTASRTPEESASHLWPSAAAGTR